MLKTEINNGIPEVTPQEVQKHLAEVAAGQIKLIDVRRPDEFTGELGHIQGAELVTLGPDLQTWIDGMDSEDEVIFVCRSGGRSGQATGYAQQSGRKKVYNMTGGMLLWNELKLPTQK